MRAAREIEYGKQQRMTVDDIRKVAMSIPGVVIEDKKREQHDA